MGSTGLDCGRPDGDGQRDVRAQTQRHLGHRLARVVDNIAHFDVNISYYRPGRDQLTADALSRREEHAAVQADDSHTLEPLLMQV